jgi:hypothetical protein
VTSGCGKQSPKRAAGGILAELAVACISSQRRSGLMARPGYTNIAPTPERDRLFADIAAAQGMNAETHKHRVEMIDQGLRLLAQKTRGETMATPPWAMTDEEVLAGSEYTFPVATDLSYYGPDATEQDVAEYTGFTKQHLSKIAGRPVEVYNVEHYSSSEPDGMNDLRNRVWDAFCRSH